jgi:hypothetical protein
MATTPQPPVGTIVEPPPHEPIPVGPVTEPPERSPEPVVPNPDPERPTVVPPTQPDPDERTGVEQPRIRDAGSAVSALGGEELTEVDPRLGPTARPCVKAVSRQGPSCDRA